MLKVFVGLQVIGLCCLCDTVDHSGCLGSVYGINDFPVLLSDAEATDGTCKWRIPTVSFAEQNGRDA